MLSLGIIVSGLTKDQFKSLSHPSFESISPAAMRHLQPEHFEHVKLIQLRSLPDETVAQFDELHLK